MLNGKLFIAYSSAIHTWSDGKINDSSDSGDLYTNQSRDYMDNFNPNGGYFVNGGGINKAINVDGEIYMALHNANKIVKWGAGSFNCSSLADYQATSNPTDVINWSESVTHNPIPVTDGEHMIVVDDIDQKVNVYKKIPTSNDAKPDFVYSTPYEIGDAALHSYTDGGSTKTAFILTSRAHNIIYIWRDFKFDGDLAGAQPDIVLGKNIGGYYFNKEMEYVEFDGTYLYISTYVNGEYQVLIFKGLPGKDSKPIAFIKGLTDTTEISSNGNYFAIRSDNVIWLYKTSQLAAASESAPVTLNSGNIYGQVANLNIGDTPTADNDREDGNYQSCIDQKFNIYSATINGTTYTRHERTVMRGLGDVLVTTDGKLIAADGQDDRVIIWNDIEGAIAGNTVPTILGHGAKAYEMDDTIGIYAVHDMSESNASDTFCMPKYLAYDGKNLWVGEFKFGNRLLRFAAK